MKLFNEFTNINIKIDKNFNITNENDFFKGNFFDYVPKIFHGDILNLIQTFDDDHRSTYTRIYYEDDLLPVVISIKGENDSFILELFCDESLYKFSEMKSVEAILEYDVSKKKIISYTDDKCHLIDKSPTEFRFDKLKVSDESKSTFISFFENIEEENQIAFCYIQAKVNNDRNEWYQLKHTFGSTANKNIYYVRLRNVDADFDQRIAMIRKSLKDPLTGVLQKESIKEHITDYVRAQNAEPALLAIVDIDYFKQINDTYGHAFGDLVVSEVAKMLEIITLKDGRNGKIGRLGGDEFVIFIPKMSTNEEMRTIGREIRFGISSISYEEIKSFSISATIGIATFPEDGTNVDLLYKKADIALYRGKKKGRGCYVIYDAKKHGMVSEEKEIVDLHQIAQNAKDSSTYATLLSESIDFLITSDLKDAGENIVECLRNYGKFYGLDRILVRMQQDNELYSRDVILNDETILGLENYTIERCKQLEPYFAADNVYSCENCGLLTYKNYSLQKLLIDFHTKSIVIIKFPLFNNSIGYVSFEMTTLKRVWQPTEVLMFKLLAQAVGSLVKKYYTRFNKLP